MRFLFSAVLFVAVIGSIALAEEVLDKEQIEKWSEYYQQRAERCELNFLKKSDVEIKLVEKPVLRWHNPIRQTTHGECFVWTADDRPVAFASIFSYPKQNDRRNVAQATNNFSDQTLVVKDMETASTMAIIERAEGMRMVPDSPKVAQTPTQRLTQLRGIARQFAASSAGTEREDARPLRLLTAPVYRYPENRGALFAYVMGTDPEVMLLLESRVANEGERWFYQAARHSHTGLSVTHRDAEVWRYDQGTAMPEYVSQHGIDEQPRILQ